MKKIIILLLIMSSSLFARMSTEEINKDIENLFKIVNQYQDIRIKDEFYSVDMKRLLEMTCMIESRYGTNNYKGRVAKSPFQYEMDTATYYIKQVNILKEYLEYELGREINVYNEKDCVYITYLIYMSKFRFHFDWLHKYKHYYTQSNDIEWLVYKVFWNSVKGASTYNKWIERSIEKEMMFSYDDNQ